MISQMKNLLKVRNKHPLIKIYKICYSYKTIIYCVLAFQATDTDNSGFISLNELRICLSAVYGDEPPENGQSFLSLSLYIYIYIYIGFYSSSTFICI